MRMLLSAKLPHEPFNQAVRDGTAGATLAKILEASGAEAVYFTEEDGHRQAILLVNVTAASDIPRLSEPWFLNFGADCRFRIVMTPEDLAQAGLDEIGQQWA
ncbi:MAG: panthothenate synthetase [Armatimonadetes bacterium]|nr:panthothenate synthetase [Armatimonadota bacterium]